MKRKVTINTTEPLQQYSEGKIKMLIKEEKKIKANLSYYYQT